jgi:hypothetical protein
LRLVLRAVSRFASDLAAAATRDTHTIQHVLCRRERRAHSERHRTSRMLAHTTKRIRDGGTWSCHVSGLPDLPVAQQSIGRLASGLALALGRWSAPIVPSRIHLVA